MILHKVYTNYHFWIRYQYNQCMNFLFHLYSFYNLDDNLDKCYSTNIFYYLYHKDRKFLCFLRNNYLMGNCCNHSLKDQNKFYILNCIFYNIFNFQQNILIQYYKFDIHLQENKSWYCIECIYYSNLLSSFCNFKDILDIYLP